MLAFICINAARHPNCVQENIMNAKWAAKYVASIVLGLACASALVLLGAGLVFLAASPRHQRLQD